VTNAAGPIVTPFEQATPFLGTFSGTFVGYQIPDSANPMPAQPPGTLIGSYAYVGTTPPSSGTTAEFFVLYNCSTRARCCSRASVRTGPVRGRPQRPRRVSRFRRSDRRASRSRRCCSRRRASLRCDNEPKRLPNGASKSPARPGFLSSTSRPGIDACLVT
jgi:hypothetical protein